MNDLAMIEQAKWIVNNTKMSISDRIDRLSRLVNTYNAALILGDKEALAMDAELDQAPWKHKP